MEYLVQFFIFLFGLCLGSFLNVVICRLETGEEMIKTRSHCARCGQVLAWYDLIPLASFLWLNGRCRYCGKKISWQYPLVELATGLLVVFIFNFQFPILQFLTENLFVVGCSLYVLCSLVVIFVYDLHHYIIPDVILFPAIIVTVLWRGFESLLLSGGINEIISHFSLYFFSALGAAIFFLVIILITRGKGMGLGDAKLAFLMGLLLGWPGILWALFLAFFAGAAVGIGLVFLGKKNMKSQIPFGPFLIGGTMILLFFGRFFLEWYGSYYF